MLRWLLIGLAVYFFYRAARRFLALRASVRHLRPSEANTPSELVECSICKTYVLKEHARLQGGAWVCRSH